MLQTHIIVMSVTTERPVTNLHELIADRAWRIDGVSHAEAHVAKIIVGGPSDRVSLLLSDLVASSAD